MCHYVTTQCVHLVMFTLYQLATRKLELAVKLIAFSHIKDVEELDLQALLGQFIVTLACRLLGMFMFIQR